VRLLWSLPKAAPALLRHLAAYVDLASLDLAKTQREIAGQLVAAAIFGVCAGFAILMGCLLVVASTWDTPYRVTAIAWMAGGFLLIAVIAAVYRAKAARAQSELFASVRREWQEDRLLLERLLSDEN
jgi:uncharacterized membrane protein YqjE